MSLILAKLQNVHRQGGKIIARCPVCAEAGHDAEGEHLVIYEQGHFACVVHPGAGGKEHRSRIFQLVGDRDPRSITVRPAPRKPVLTPIMTAILGRLGREFYMPPENSGQPNHFSTESVLGVPSVRGDEPEDFCGRYGRVNQTLAQCPSDIIYIKESETGVRSVRSQHFETDSGTGVQSVRKSNLRFRNRSSPEDLTASVRLSDWLATAALPTSFSLSAWERVIQAEQFRTRLLLDLTCHHTAMFAPALDRARRVHALFQEESIHVPA